MKCNSRTKTYMNLLQFLKRQKLENPGVLALLFIETFDVSKPTNYQCIKIDDLKDRKIIPSENYRNFSEWRTKMINMGILICMADSQEQCESSPNFKASMFKYGPSIKKYIEAILVEKSSVFERLDKKIDLDDMAALENRMNERLELAATKEKMADLELRVLDLEDNFVSIMLHFLPPDNETRREIVKKHGMDRQTCFEELEKEKKERERSHLKVI